jgi:hypothetical protein
MFGLLAKVAGVVVSALPWKIAFVAVVVESSAGANNMRTVGLEILSADIPITPGVPLMP